MKKTLLFLAAVAFSFSSAIAQDEGIEKTLTSNSSIEVESGSVACGTTGGPSSENHYYKKFDFADLGVEDDFTINSFEFGVESVVGAEVNLTVELWVTTKNDFPATWGGPDYVKLVSESITVTDEDALSLVSVEFEEKGIPEGSNVIAHVHHGDLESENFYIGSNPQADSQPSYMMAAGCDINTPSPTSSIGYPDMNIVMLLKGEEGVLGVEDFVTADLTLYPNPASDQFNIASGNEVIQSVIVRDILGKTIQTIEVNGLNQDVNVSNLPKGLYLVEVELETGRAVQKLIKK